MYNFLSHYIAITFYFFHHEKSLPLQDSCFQQIHNAVQNESDLKKFRAQLGGVRMNDG